MEQKVEKIRNLFFQSKGMKTLIEKALSEAESEKIKLEKRLKLLELAQLFLQNVAQKTQEKLKMNIEDIVNLALETCFPNEYEFQLQFNIARGKTDAELVFLSQKTGRAIDPMNASGGGVVDVTCWALRLASYVLSSNCDNVMILDEPMKFVSKDLMSRVCEVVSQLSTKLRLQIIMVTHENQFIDIADRVFEVKKNVKGVSNVYAREK